jgi:hypothetical protein
VTKSYTSLYVAYVHSVFRDYCCLESIAVSVDFDIVRRYWLTRITCISRWSWRKGRCSGHQRCRPTRPKYGWCNFALTTLTSLYVVFGALRRLVIRGFKYQPMRGIWAGNSAVHWTFAITDFLLVIRHPAASTQTCATATGLSSDSPLPRVQVNFPSEVHIEPITGRLMVLHRQAAKLALFCPAMFSVDLV